MRFSQRLPASLLLLFSGARPAQTISFLYPSIAYNSRSSRGATTCNNRIATADFNGDGKPDLAYSYSELTPFAGVVLANGDGTFTASASFPINQAAGHPLTGDFNGDGKPDVLISGSRTWLYSGNGDGKFGVPLEVTACTILDLQIPGVLVAADFNRDGKTDLVCSTQVLLGNGNGTFRNAGTLDAYAVLTADFNSDGIPDLLLASAGATTTLAVVLGHGDGTFGPDLPVGTPLNLYWASFAQLIDRPAIQAGDFNGDRRPDLVAAPSDGTKILVLPSLGDRTFGAPIATSGVPGTITAATDFNGDGKLDLVAGDAVLAGNGDGTSRKRCAAKISASGI